MKIAVEEINSVRKAIRVEVPQDIVAREFESVYSDLNRRVRIPGFRPGKAPRALLEKRYAQTVQDDVIRRLVPDYCQRAIKEAHLSPVELPSIEDIQLNQKTPLTFKATVEIRPVFELQKYAGLSVKSPVRALKEEDMLETLEALRKRNATLEAHPPDHEVQEGDFAMIDFEGEMEGRPFDGGSAKGVLVEVGSNRLVPGFEEQLKGAKAGDKREVRVTFPVDYPKKELSGKPAVFQVEIREIKRQALPELDDEFAKDLGEFSSLEDLKTKIRADLEAQVKKENDRSARTALMKRLVEIHPIELPPSMVERELRSMLAQVQSRLPKGTTLDQANIGPEFVKNEMEPAAREKVMGHLILDAVAEKESIEISGQELEESLSGMALEMRVKPEDIRRLIISREGSMDGLVERLKQDKALDLIVGKTEFEPL